MVEVRGEADMKKIIRTIFLVLTVLSLAFTAIAATACGETTEPENQACVHEWGTGTVLSEPSCVKNGVKEFTCGKCGMKKTEAVPALGHRFGDGEVTTDPKCEEVGVRTFTCSVCDAEVTEDVDAIGHEYAEEGHVSKEPTCTGKGVFSYPCTHDGCNKTRDEEIPAKGHVDEDHNGYCDVCDVFFGSVSWDITNLIYEDGPWISGHQGTVLYWSYNLDESSGTRSILSLDNEILYGDTTTSVLADFTQSCKASSPDGAYAIHLPMDGLIAETDYTLVFYAKTDGNFTGNLNKMLNNDNFGNNMTCKNVAYDMVYSADKLNSEDWTKVVVSFTANPFVNDGTCQFRIACDVGLDGWTGKLWLGGFTLYDSEYYENLNAPADGQHHIDIATLGYVSPLEIAKEGVSYWNYDLSDGGEYVPFSVTEEEFHGTAASAIKATFDESVTSTNGEYVINITMDKLEQGKDYVLTYYAKADPDFTGNIKKQLNNDTFTNSQNPTCVNPQMLYEIPDLTTEWQEVSVRFTASPHPEKGLCSWQIAYNVGENGYSGTMYLSDFTVSDYANNDDGLHHISTAYVSTAMPWEITREGITYWNNFDSEPGSAYVPFSVTSDQYYGTDKTAIKGTFDGSITSPDKAYMLEITMDKLESGKKYTLTYYAKAEEGFTGNINKQLNNNNFTADGFPSCVDPSFNEVELSGEWQKVEVEFTAAPHETKGLCCWRIAFDVGESGYEGTVYLSDFTVTESEDGSAETIPEDLTDIAE